MRRMGFSLFLDAEFERLKLGVIEADRCIGQMICDGFVIDHFSEAIDQCLRQANVEASRLSQIYFLNGPGSTMGIRTLCAFVNTLILLNKIDQSQVFTCNHLYFYQAYETYINQKEAPFQIVAKVGLNQCLRLSVEDKTQLLDIQKCKLQDVHDRADDPLFFLPHPALQGQTFLTYDLEKIPSLLTLKDLQLWHNGAFDLFQV